MQNFSPQEAMEYAKQGLIELWVHEYLNTKGQNAALSDGLKKEKRYWLGPLSVSLDKLKRCCGTEENMEFSESIINWEKRINEMSMNIRNGWLPPPLIVEYKNKEFSIRDGNHRYEALKREKYDEYPVIIWFNNMAEFLKRERAFSRLQS